MRLHCPALLLALLLSPACLRADDRRGTPPGGATARLGTTASCLAFTPDGRTLVTGRFWRVRQWDAATGKERPCRIEHESPVTALAVSPDGDSLAVAGTNGKIHLHERTSGKRLRTFAGQPAAAYSRGWPLEVHEKGTLFLAFARDGRLVAGNADGSIWAWDLASGKKLRDVREDGKVALRMALSPDGFTVAVVHGETISLHDLRTAREVGTVTGRTANGGTEWFWSAAFSADGKYLAASGRTHFGRIRQRPPTTGGTASTAAVFEVATRTEVLRLGPDVGNNAVAFSRDGRMLLAGGGDPVRAWDLGTGREVTSGAKGGWDFPLLLSPGGKVLASANASATTLWNNTWSGEPGKPALLSGERLRQAWDDLAGPDAARAYRTMGELLNTPVQALLLLRQRLRRAEPKGEERSIPRLIEKLDGDDFAVREKARVTLEMLAERAEPALLRARDGQPSVELWYRIEKLLARLGTPSPERLRLSRAVAVLERLRTPEARRLLVWLSGGAPGAGLTAEAAGAVRRLDGAR